ncbi:patatin-like phospholipase family protein [Rivibacter subsaxonicus]|uniref:NTE family protein n=1 Tax=Rivibacter subsaxonicus TaxID=457575 RepID=A0A4Q7VFW9_9BURK|nr:patatin-like phospholipase family protein [Rivibacter subsaxonicus]RZT94896.1 NTE family protein [Rivibacter subsaxonicus]
MSRPFFRQALWLGAAIAGLMLAASAPAQTRVPTVPPEAAASAAIQPPAPAPTTSRPRIGLVLSGGGARGMAHVGVLKVLERERVPVDVIAGTSMGAIIGGLYASGMSAEQIETELGKVDWDALFTNRVERSALSQRRKSEDFVVAPAIEVGMRDGEVRLPTSTVSSRGLELLLRRYTLPVRSITDFDKLPTPFRAVATDMENGQALILKQGDLALAMRSSMSVPGVFAPTEIEGRILGDGGLVNNVPIDVARAMGADIVIVVNIGTPLSGRETLGSIVGVTVQMISILTEQNVQRSLATLGPKDLLIAPELGELTAGDFPRLRDFVKLGELQANAQVVQLAGLALEPASYDQWLLARSRTADPTPELGFIRFAGAEITHPQRLAPQLESKPGQVFDEPAAARDAVRLAAGGDYSRVDFQLARDELGNDGLVFVLDEKDWGPNYFRIGLDLSTDFSGVSEFNIKLSHDRHWLDERGTEWRNILQIGTSPYWFTELYRPLNWSPLPGWDWFVAPAMLFGREQYVLYSGPEGPESGRLRRTAGRVGVDLGKPWGNLGELRVGPYWQRWTDKPVLLSEDYVGPRESTTRSEIGLRTRVTFDQLDYAYFPSRGYRVVADLAGGGVHTSGAAASDDDRFARFEADATLALTPAKRHTIVFYGRTGLAGGAADAGQGFYNLGGFQMLSGYQPGQVEGNYMVFGRAVYRYQLTPPKMTRGLVAGFSLEAGNGWNDRSAMSLGSLRAGYSAYIAADTGIGPLYLGLTYAPRGSAGIYLFLGRP